MTGKPYPFLSEDFNTDSDVLFFTLLSQGKEVIPKTIVFAPIDKSGNKYYNWGFGDLIIDDSTGEFFISDKTESNNGDVKTVFYTVVSTLSIFFDIHPNATVYIEGSNQQRTKIYNGLIIRHWGQISPFYNILGFSNGKIEPFRSGIVFEYLLISRKKL
jgi:hypothetical protein